MMLIFTLRLAWRQLTYERGKLTAAILGVMFACVLVFMQMGFRDGLYESISKLVNNFDGDLFIQHKQTEALWRSIPFERAEMMRALALPEVESVSAVYIGQAPWKNPVNHTKRTLLVLGFKPEDTLFKAPELKDFEKILQKKDTVIFDQLSRPEFGDIAGLLKQGEVITEVNDYKVNVAGVFKMGASFAADGNMITSDQNFMRIFLGRTMNQVDVGVIRLKKGVDNSAVKARLRSLLNDNVYLYDWKGLKQHEFEYWQNNAPIGFIFGFGMIMGLIVGMVIVYQILFTDITNHISEFATLKAMGYTLRYLLLLVFSSSLILAIVGFIPGFIISFGLYRLVEGAIFIPMPMPLEKILTVFGMILLMCTFSGMLAMQKMRSANPAEML